MTGREYLENIKIKMMNHLEEQINALPPGFNKDRFVLNCLTVIRGMLEDDDKKKNLLECSMESVILCFLKGAFLGLDFINGECYAICYKGNFQFQTSYLGEIKLCKKYSKNKIKDIYAKNVREGDFFEEVIEGGQQKITWKPIPFNDNKIIGSFAVVLYEDGSMIYDTMSAAMIEKTRQDYSKMKDSPAWKKSPGEMYKKTVLRRLTKLVDIDFDNAQQVQAFDDGGDASFELTGKIEKPASKVIDVSEQIKQAQLPDNGPKKTVSQITAPSREAVPVEDEFPQAGEQMELEELDLMGG